MSSYPPYIAYPSAPAVVRAIPNPPRMNWGVVFVLSLCTLGLFGMAWMIVQCVWVRKVYGKSKALPWAIAYAAILPALFVMMFAVGILAAVLHKTDLAGISAIVETIARILIFFFWIAAVFTLRGELSDYPLDIPLGGIMTFFFGPVYFQYHLSDYQVSDAVHQFRGPLRTELEMPVRE